MIKCWRKPPNWQFILRLRVPILSASSVGIILQTDSFMSNTSSLQQRKSQDTSSTVQGRIQRFVNYKVGMSFQICTHEISLQGVQNATKYQSIFKLSWNFVLCLSWFTKSNFKGKCANYWKKKPWNTKPIQRKQHFPYPITLFESWLYLDPFFMPISFWKWSEKN